MPKILAFAGSLRKDSYNKKLVRVAADAARAARGRSHIHRFEGFSAAGV
jgi:NAD(P)H-dependent FMN reductase